MKFFQKTKKEVNKHQKALSELIRVVGEERILSAIEDRICYSYDATRQKVLPDIVVRPADTNDVSNTLKIASKYKVPIYARGAGSGLTGGAVPLMGGIVFDLKNMNRIIEISPDDFTATVEPGVVTKELQDEVAKFDLFYPPDPSSAAFSTIGGNVAECAGGITGLKYGVTRDYILSLEIVLPDGSVINTGGKALRSTTGYDLTRLFTGSEGTLGVFTKITVKLIPKPEKILTVAAYFSERDDAVDAADLIIDNNILPRTLEFLDQMTINAVRGYTGADIGEDVKALLLIDIDGTEGSISHEVPIIENACRESNAFRTKVAETAEERDAIWATRRSISPALYNIAPHKINEDICVPRSKIKEMLQRVDRIKTDQPIYIANFGHIGDGNIHVNTMYSDDPGQEELAESIVNKVMKEVVKLGGSISGEHGIGNKKSQFMELEIPSHEYEIMKKFKSYFDPKGIMNPGKMFIR
ncbi:MAG: FAD-linked oxidase C-terminal domain-containing protein [Candidatus Scalindua sp.]|jgi:glycolate oxidase|nr:FAD-linked oxidase C-terminal domain-containing protein [Candidatus Scalindua sp.]MDV5165495.1 FAD-linked oxidase C-terminal domain-containing protein [Candidatus Scalindua sp.]